jgi:hypothetical protein
MAGMDGVPLPKQVRKRWPQHRWYRSPLRHMTERRRFYAGGFAFLESHSTLTIVSVIQVAQNRSELRHCVQDAKVERLSRLDLEAARMDFALPKPSVLRFSPSTLDWRDGSCHEPIRWSYSEHLGAAARTDIAACQLPPYLPF